MRFEQEELGGSMRSNALATPAPEENAVVGVFTALSLLALWPERQPYAALAAVKLFSVPFFAVHYGMLPGPGDRPVASCPVAVRTVPAGS